MLLLHLAAAATLASVELASPQPTAAAQQPCATATDCALIAQIKRQDVPREREQDRSRDRRDSRNWDHDRSRFRWEYDRQLRWRSERHPRHQHWVGQHLPPRGAYMVILDYRAYGLPRPRPGHVYVRVDRDVFLISEATRRIVAAFILLDAVGR